jgi:hypothetical protein
MNRFEMVHELASQRRKQKRDHEDAMLPLERRISELEGALRALIGAADGLKLPVKLHTAARAAESVLAARVVSEAMNEVK